MLNYISQTLGNEITVKDFEVSEAFPLYLKNGYSYVKCLILGQSVLFVTPENFNLSSYKKHCVKIEKLTSAKAVLCLDRITPYQRKALIEEHIPFVIKDSQIYLPFLSVCLSEKYEQKADVEKFTPITQLVFLYLFYNNVHLTATEISEKLHCTIMSASRAYKTLTDCGLFKYVKEGRNKYITPIFQNGELLKSAEHFLINPVEKKIYYRKDENLQNNFVAGLSALAQKTMLSVSENEKCFAVLKKNCPSTASVISNTEYQSIGGIKLELWSYEPQILATDKTVDDISLILSLSNETDERILAEIETIRRKYQW